jgi:hypothetical protein
MPLFCPYCGEGNAWSGAYCRGCGRAFEPELPAESVLAVRLIPKSPRAAALTADGVLWTWKRTDASAIQLLSVEDGQMIAAAIAGDLQTVVYAIADDGKLRRIRIGEGGRIVAPLLAPVRALDVTTSGDLAVVACGDGSVHWLQVHTGQLARSLVIDSPANAIAIADNGVSIASCIDGGLRRLDKSTGAVTLIGHAPRPTSAVAVTSDGSIGVTGGNDGRVVWWSGLNTRASYGADVVRGGTGVRALAIASETFEVLIAAEDGTIRLHSLLGEVLQNLTRLPRAGEGSGSSSLGTPPAAPIDNDVQFTVYRPSVLSPGSWEPLIVYVHKSDPLVDPDYGLIYPLEEVKARARALFGDVETHAHSVDAQQALLHGNALHIAPDLPGLMCDPASVTVVWRGPVHEARFVVRASPRLAGSVVRGWVRVWCGPLILGELSVSLRVAAVSEAPATFQNDRPTSQGLGRYRKIFPSYSRRDDVVVQQIAVAARALGDQYLQDVLTLRSGEPWHDRLLELIEEADVFQLFWSSNSMHSPHCRTEWEHALALRRPMFVRPLYWEDPFPEAPELGMPPAELRSLHFARVPVTAPSAIPAPQQRQATPSEPAAGPSGPPAGPYAHGMPSEYERHSAPSTWQNAPPARTPLSPPGRKRSRAAAAVAIAVLILAVALCAALILSRGGGQ